MARVAIIGCGRIGSSLVRELIRESFVEEIGVWSRKKEELAARAEALAALSVYETGRNKVAVLDRKRLSAYDLIVLALKDHYDPREMVRSNSARGLPPNDLRYAGLFVDLPLVLQWARVLSTYNGTLAVISNPVDLLTSILSDLLPRTAVVGLGLSVDALRVRYFLDVEHQLNIPRSIVQLIGEHGRGFFLGKESLEALRPLCGEQVVRWSLDACVKAERMAYRSVRTLGYTLHDCAAVFSTDVLWLLGADGGSATIGASIADGKACIGRRICRTVEGKGMKFNALPLSDSDRQRLDRSAAKVTRIKQHLGERIDIYAK